jgi:hypothetical protein
MREIFAYFSSFLNISNCFASFLDIVLVGSEYLALMILCFSRLTLSKELNSELDAELILFVPLIIPIGRRESPGA